MRKNLWGVIIINQGWTDNLGDVAIGKTLKKELKDFHPLELQFAPIMAKPAQTTASKILELIKLDCRYRRWIKKQLNEISEPISAAIIGGGELLATNMNFNSAMKIWIEQLHKRKSCVPLGNRGGYTNPIYRMRYKSALAKADEICVRDAYSKQVVEKCYARTPLSYPDVVFLYGKEKKTHDKNSKGKKVCCNVLSYDYYKNAGGSKSKEEYFDEWKEILDSYTDSDTIILFSSTTIEDRKTTEEFSKKYVWQKSCVSFPDTVDEYWSQLEDVDYVISGRMHAMILAMQQGCICVPYEWKDKLEVFKREYCDSGIELAKVRRNVELGFAALKKGISGLEEDERKA